MDITYIFDSVNFKTHGVYVSKSEGLIGRPNRKEPEKYHYPDESGYVPDLATVAYEARKITLDCFIKAAGPLDLVSQYNSFTAAMLGKTAVKTLQVAIVSGVTSLYFQAYVESISELDKTLKAGRNVGTFKIVFIEPRPAIS